jgi:hypothetical protein
MSKPKIKITYYSDDAPRVELPEGLDVELEFVDGDEKDLQFMEHAGVTIYRTLWKGCTSENWFSTLCDTDPDHQDKDDPGDFDVRDLPDIPEEELPKYEALFPDVPENVQTPPGWKEERWREAQQEIIDQKRIIAYAIDQGKITAE